MDEHEQETSGVSRRKVLQRIGLAGAAVWAAPVVTGSLPAAHAAVSPRCTSPCIPTFCLREGSVCGASGQFDRCICSQTVEGACFCAEDVTCGGTPSCTSSAECPDGYQCMATCCGTVQCLPPCGTNLAGVAEGAVAASSAQ